MSTPTHTHTPKYLARSLRLTAITLALLANANNNTNAVNIVIQLNDTDDAPAYDPDGAILVQHFNAAADIWEALLPGGGTYEVDVWWEPLPGNTLGQWSPALGDNNIRIEPAPSSPWFLDPTPSQHTEYDFTTPDPPDPLNQGATIVKQLTATQTNNAFDGPVIPTLEVGYRGAATSTAATGRFDLLSVVLHELGHELGVSSEADGEYEFFPSHVGGANFIAEQDSDSGHIALQVAPLMCEGCERLSVRRLPSAIDVLVAANDQDITNVNLSRLYFVQGTGATDWNNSLSWIGGDVPNSNDDVFLYHGGVAQINGTANAQNLTFDDGSDLHTNNNHLQVPGTTSIPTGSSLTVQAGGHAQLATVNITGTGTLRLLGGTATLSFTENQSATGLTGNGTVNVTGSYSNSGGILPSGGLLTMQGTGSIDLDGTDGDGVVNVLVADLKINAPMPEAFDGTMNINDGQTATLSQWTLGAGGDLNLLGSDSAPATLDSIFGARHDLNGSVDVDRLAVIEPTIVRFLQSGDVSVPQSNDKLTIAAIETDFIGASFTGAGEVEQQTNITVRDTTTVDVNTFDWGNSTLDNVRTLRVIPGHTLTINAATSAGIDNEFRGDITLDSGSLEVNFNAPWRLPDDVFGLVVPGRLFMHNSGTATPSISGQTLKIQNLLHVTGGPASIFANTETAPTTNIVVDPGATLTLGGEDNNLHGGSITGPGTLSQFGDFNVFETTIINTARFDWGNSVGSDAPTNLITIGNEEQLIILSNDTGNPANAFHGKLVLAGGQLHTDFDQPWTLPDQVNFPGGFSFPRGAITIPDDPFDFYGTASITGQEFILHGDFTLLDSRAEFHANVQFHDAAKVQLGQSGIIDDAFLILYGLSKFHGGTFTGPGKLVQANHIFIKDDTTIDVANFDWGNSFDLSTNNHLNIDPNQHLTINSPNLGEPDNPYRGTIDLRGKLTVNTPGFWNLPALTLVPTGTPGGVLELKDNRTPGDDPPTLAGSDLHVHGIVLVNAELAVTENIIAFLDNSVLEFNDTSTLRFDNAIELQTTTINHHDAFATLASNGTGQLIWGLDAHPTIVGDTTGSLTFDLPTGTPVFIPSILTNSITIAPEATLHIAGRVDPLTSTTNPDRHIPVINNSTNTFNISNPNVTTTTVTGIGNTQIHPGGTLNVQSITQNSITIDPTATLNLTTDDTTITTTDVLANYGTLNNAGTTTVTGTATGSGDFNVPLDETLFFNDLVAASGHFPGRGTIHFRDEYDPNGNAAQTNNFGGPVSFRAANKLTINVDTNSAQSDHLNITGPVTLDGNLNIEFTPGGTFADEFPPLGTEFTAMTYLERTTGTRDRTMFDSITNTLINTAFALAPLFTDTNASGTDDTLILRATIPGDLNLDNKVSIADLAEFALNFNTTLPGAGLHNDATNTNSWQLGDFNTDGAITVADLSLLALNFGFDATDPSSTPLGLTPTELLATLPGLAILDPATLPGVLPRIPEPTTATTILLAIACYKPQRKNNQISL